MWNFLKTRGIDLAVTSIAMAVLMIGPAWATVDPGLPGPAVGAVIAGAAIIGALVIAKWRHRE